MFRSLITLVAKSITLAISDGAGVVAPLTTFRNAGTPKYMYLDKFKCTPIYI